jgi:iron complex outermembrane receptor protein
VKLVRAISLLLTLAVCGPIATAAQGLNTGTMLAELDIDITQLSIEDLLNLKITSVSKKSESITRAPAAVHVLTAEDIRRSGVTSIPEALRLVPGIQVARIDGNKWAVSSRGFNSRSANKLLVLIDGRNIYDFIFSGVLWETKDVMLESVDRIEVIRGPGGTLWGANAVNGVINIITRQAKDTQGGLITAASGTEERAFGGVRYGFQLGADSYLRVYAKGWQRDAGFLTTGTPDDNARYGRGGFRFDSQLSADDSFTLQGDMYEGMQYTADNALMPKTETSGGNMLGRWTHSFADGSQTYLRLYHDHTKIDAPTLTESRDTVDLEFNHALPQWGAHRFIYGLTYRHTTDQIGNTTLLVPDHRTDRLVGAFVQDEIELSPKKLYLTLGSKFEENDYTGSEVQPNMRLSWHASETATLWAAVSKAVRTPSRLEDDLFNVPTVNPDGSVRLISGDHMQEAEELIAYETGFRFSPGTHIYFDIAAFYNEYDALITIEESSIGNKSSGSTKGLEIAATYTPTSTCKLTAGYTLLQMDLELDADSMSPATMVTTIEGGNPEHQAFIRMGKNFSGRYELDVTVRYTDELPAQNVSSYTVADLRLAAHIDENLELSLVGQNLFEKHHFEQRAALSTEVEDGVYAKIQWRF